MALLPITFTTTIDEDGGIKFDVAGEKRLTAFHLWALATFLEHIGDNLNQSNLAARIQQDLQANGGRPTLVAPTPGIVQQLGRKT